VITEVGQIVSGIAAAIEEQTTVTKDVAGNIAQASAGVTDANERVAQTATVAQSISQDVAHVSGQGQAIKVDGSQVEESAGALNRLTGSFKEIVGRFQLGRGVTDFGPVKQGHLHWRSRLVAMFDGRETIGNADVTDHTHCAFGKWYYGDACEGLKQLPIFAQIGTHHQAFHTLVTEIVQAWNGGRQNEARERFQKLLPHTDALFALLDQLTLDAVKAGSEMACGSQA
jgi:hypothetical protein